MKKYALISVSDKSGVTELARSLSSYGYELLSTGGTAKMLLESGLKVTNVSDVTGFPECLDGRVKTLHPKVHGGLLAMRDNPEHMKTLSELGIDLIDIAVINLYPFRETIAKPNVSYEDAVENIDIGGPAMLRAAAKNHNDVTVITDPKDYGRVLEELARDGKTTLETRKYLAYKVFAHTASYDAMIADYLAKQQNIEFPDSVTMTFEAAQELRYGENPHQRAKYYRELTNIEGTLASAKQLHGKELSYNNISDTHGAIEVLSEFRDTGKITAVGVKHANPCAVASADTLLEAWTKAYNADPVSIYGGIVALSSVVDAATAAEMAKIFLEIIIAPGFDDDAIEILSAKKNIRLLELPSLATGLPHNGKDFKRVSGGLLLQDPDLTLVDQIVVTSQRKPTEKEMQDMLFAMRIVKHVKSNAIVLAKDDCSVGIGVGQVCRIWPTQQAIEHGGERVIGSAMASDAFFPFDDCVRAAARAGVTAIMHPGGSKNDEQSIKACDELGIALVTMGQRHFKHS